MPSPRSAPLYKYLRRGNQPTTGETNRICKAQGMYCVPFAHTPSFKEHILVLRVRKFAELNEVVQLMRHISPRVLCGR